MNGSDDSLAFTPKSADELDRLLRRLLAAIQPLRDPDKTISKGVYSAIKPASDSAQAAENHLREHRMGRPSKLDTDPELNDFVRQRIATMTFPQIAEAIQLAFPPERRVSTSSVHRWWMREKVQ